MCAGAGYGLADGTEPTSFRQLANTMLRSPTGSPAFVTSSRRRRSSSAFSSARFVRYACSSSAHRTGIRRCARVERFGGRIVSVDFDAERIALARRNLERAGLEADLRLADAAEVLTLSASGTWDLVFLDSEWGADVGYWPDLLRALRLGGSPSPGRRGRVLHVGARRRPGSNRVLRAFPNAGQRKLPSAPAGAPGD